MVGGTFRSAIAILQDMAVLKKAEEALRRSEVRFALAVQGSTDGMWDWPDVAQDGEWWSPRWYELLGYANEEIEANYATFKAFLHPDDVGMVEERVRAHFERRVPFEVEYRLRTKSGRGNIAGSADVVRPCGVRTGDPPICLAPFRTSPSASASRNNSSNHRRWSWSGGWPAASLTISTTC